MDCAGKPLYVAITILNYITSLNFLALLPDPRMELTSSRVTSAPDGPPVSASFLGMDQGLLFFGILLSPCWF